MTSALLPTALLCLIVLFLQAAAMDRSRITPLSC